MILFLRTIRFWLFCFAGLFALFFLMSHLGRPVKISEVEKIADKKLQCVSYTPFEKGEGPWDLGRGLKFPKKRLEHDLRILSARFDCVRVYSVVGMDDLPMVARKFGMKLMLGAWVNGSAQSTRAELKKLILMANIHKDIIKSLVIGNETLLRKEVSPKQLIDYIRWVKSEVENVPVTYADVWEFWLEYPEVASAVDFVTIHVLPYWENDPTAIDDAIPHVKEVLEKVTEKFPDKKIFVGETGWPSFGRMREGALPSLVNQAKFISSFVTMANSQGLEYNIIEAFDQVWKRGNEGAVGGFWGIYDHLRRDKGSLSVGGVSEYPRWRNLLACTGFIFFLLMVLALPVSVLNRWQISVHFIVSLVASVCLTFQGLQFQLIVRDFDEFIWSVILLMLDVMLVILFLRMIKTPECLLEKEPSFFESFSKMHQRHRFFQPENILFRFKVILGFIFLYASNVALCFVFDSRYRTFPDAGFFLPAFVIITYLLIRYGLKRQQGLQKIIVKNTEVNTLEEKYGSLFFVLIGTFIFFNETYLNWQSNLWCVLLLVFSFYLARRAAWQKANGRFHSFRKRHGFALAALLPMVAGFGVAALLRYLLMEPQDIAHACAQFDKPAICNVRDFTGMLVYFQFAGKVSFFLGIASLFMNGRAVPYFGLFFGMMGIVLYNFDLSAMSVIINLLGVVSAARFSYNLNNA